jgi:hypothetical protein
LLSVLDQIGQKLPCVAIRNDRPKWDRDNQVGAAPTMHSFAASVPTVLGAHMPMKLLVAQRSVRTTSDKIDTPAVSAVSAVRPTSRDMCLSPKADTAPTAVSGFHSDAGFIDEYQHTRV